MNSRVDKLHGILKSSQLAYPLTHPPAHPPPSSRTVKIFCLYAAAHRRVRVAVYSISAAARVHNMHYNNIRVRVFDVTIVRPLSRREQTTAVVLNPACESGRRKLGKKNRNFSRYSRHWKRFSRDPPFPLSRRAWSCGGPPQQQQQQQLTRWRRPWQCSRVRGMILLRSIDIVTCGTRLNRYRDARAVRGISEKTVENWRKLKFIDLPLGTERNHRKTIGIPYTYNVYNIYATLK